MEQEVRRGAVLAAVSRTIFCPHTGKVLDIEDAYLITGRNDPRSGVISGDAWRERLKLMPAGWSKRIEVWEGSTGDELGES